MYIVVCILVGHELNIKLVGIMETIALFVFHTDKLKALVSP